MRLILLTSARARPASGFNWLSLDPRLGRSNCISAWLYSLALPQIRQHLSHQMDTPDSSMPSPSRGRGRGKSRGGLGKYLRARGRGRGRGRPAEFGKRLVLEDEQEAELDEEEAKELEKKYSRRQLGTNADRYAESEPELDSDGVYSAASHLLGCLCLRR